MLPASLASIHYWRAARADWPRLLDRIVELGFPAIDTYVPWAIHMPEPGAAEWGQTEPRRDLAAFLRLCQERRLAVNLRPGPHVNAELPNFGYPRWLIDDPAVQALDAAGRTVAPFDISVPEFPAPSYASEAFYRHAGAWLDEVAPRIIPFLRRNGGPVVSLQVDNEMSYFFRPGPFEMDYHPGAIALYREWLGDPQAEPPRRFDTRDIPRILRWCAFREWLLVYALDRLGKMFRERGLTGVPLTQNLPALTPRGVTAPGASPLNVWAMERALDVIGVDIYATPATYQHTRKWARYAHAASRFPSVLEFGAGRADNWTPRDPNDAAFNWRALLMHGIRAINHYMIVERERWIETPVGPTGELRPHAALYAPLNDLQRRLAGSRKQVQVLILNVRDYARLAAASKIAEPRPDPSDNIYLPDRWVSHERLGFQRPIPRDDLAWYRVVEAALLAGGYVSDIGDDSLPIETLQRYRLIVCPAFDFMPRATQEKLLGYVKRGGHLAYGPDLPYLDENLEGFRLLADYLIPFATEPDDPRFVANLLTELEVAGVQPVVKRDDPALDLAVHILPDKRRVLFVANASPEAREIAVAGLGAPFDPATAVPAPGGQVTLAPYSIGLWTLDDSR